MGLPCRLILNDEQSLEGGKIGSDGLALQGPV